MTSKQTDVVKREKFNEEEIKNIFMQIYNNACERFGMNVYIGPNNMTELINDVLIENFKIKYFDKILASSVLRSILTTNKNAGILSEYQLNIYHMIFMYFMYNKWRAPRKKPIIVRKKYVHDDITNIQPSTTKGNWGDMSK